MGAKDLKLVESDYEHSFVNRGQMGVESLYILETNSQ